MRALLCVVALLALVCERVEAAAPPCTASVVCVHGTCSGNACVCDPGYSGTDCSLWETSVELGASLTNQTLGTRQWHYYFVNASSGTGLRVTVNQTSARGDVDLYVQKGVIPTRSNNLLKDVSANRFFTLDVSGATFSTGTWYFGLYAFSTCTYDISIRALSLCPDNCSNRGTCLPSGACQCPAGFSGPSCAVGYAQLIPGAAPITSHLAQFAWDVYSLDIAAGEADVIITTTQSDLHQDVDIYVRYNAVPSVTQFDYRNISSAFVSILHIPDPQPGRYFVGVVAYATTNYTIASTHVAAGGTTCANACSGSSHGTCQSGHCACTACFEGDFCETRSCPLQLDEVVAGTLEPSAWNYYQFVGQSDSALVVRLRETLHSQDCDLYVLKDAKPTTTHFDLYDVSLGNHNSSVTIEAPDGLYWIGVYGFQACDYTLSLEEGNSTDCPRNCSGHESGLSSGVAVTGNVTVNQWRYFNFTASSAFVTVQLLETNSVGALWLFVSREGNPTLVLNDFQSVNFDRALHTIHILRATSDPQPMYVGVYGDPIMTSRTARAFSLVMWQPPASA